MLYRGQSLLGLMVSLSLSAFLLLVILQFYNYTQRQNQHILQHLRLQAELQRVVQLISKDLRRAGFRAVSDKVIQNNWFLFEQDADGAALTIQQSGSCVLFFYDLNLDGCLGTGFKKGLCIAGNRNATQEIERELFGYRLNNKMAETRLTYKNSVNQHCEQAECRRYLQEQACTGGGWTDLLDSQEYEITLLEFIWLNGNKGVEVRLAGNLRTNPNIAYETRRSIAMSNASSGRFSSGSFPEARASCCSPTPGTGWKPGWMSRPGLRANRSNGSRCSREGNARWWQ